eukprot:1411110-Amphidinium_carterae.3
MGLYSLARRKRNLQKAVPLSSAVRKGEEGDVDVTNGPEEDSEVTRAPEKDSEANDAPEGSSEATKATEDKPELGPEEDTTNGLEERGGVRETPNDKRSSCRLSESLKQQDAAAIETSDECVAAEEPSSVALGLSTSGGHRFRIVAANRLRVRRPISGAIDQLLGKSQMHKCEHGEEHIAPITRLQFVEAMRIVVHIIWMLLQTVVSPR